MNLHSLPTLNASLNALAGICLFLGWRADLFDALYFLLKHICEKYYADFLRPITNERRNLPICFSFSQKNRNCPSSVP